MEQYCLLAFNRASQAQLISSFLFLLFTLIGVLTLSIHATATSMHKILLILSYLCTLTLSVISNTKTMKSVYSKSSSQTYLLFSFGIVSLIVQQCNKLLFFIVIPVIFSWWVLIQVSALVILFVYFYLIHKSRRICLLS